MEKNEVAYVVFRVLIGFMFWCNGAKKLFGWFGGSPVELMSQMGAAGVIEFAVGLLLVIGLFTRYAASLGALLMLAAYGIAHVSRGLLPIMNGGERALLYFAAFLVLATLGAGKFSLDSRKK
jgi:putative oxidoreductase